MYFMLNYKEQTKKMTEIDVVKKIAKINKDMMTAVTLRPDFINQVKEIRLKYGIDSGKFTDDETVIESWLMNLYKNRSEFDNFNKEIENLLLDFKLPNNFNRTMNSYVVVNQIQHIPGNNCVMEFSNKEIKLVIYQKPMKEEWLFIKKRIDKFLEFSQQQKFNFLKQYNYPQGRRTLKPKPKLGRDVEILELSKKLGEKVKGFDYEYKYSDKDIEAEIFNTTSKNARAKKHINIIKQARVKAKKRQKLY
ncbi:MAG: hypothetical protein UT48_C0006G0013 [Parcubacteria group bacterium GW2011_GWE2_39_37]|uniref:Uncharacterized protein n=1 Tax=Candidatus Falkowbacteria bacterium GW2011_GWF2_39_8 TaxID=1618642 RepID=A0A0G0Q0J8_9BACT|nr:MAG: hypothetical protein UT48_C0006G0013 [Parcubacteria group bacterium GW2011_GWE2_39_37]KKR33874.1 MAG: hypothetical protein UT64_C0002G0013 [Candidatus Falkowbacteria bacterium GW2011_GWF2_39_8]